MGNYHLLLAHEVLEHSVEYLRYYATNPPSFVIMDNSLVELGSPLSAKQLITAAQTVSASCVILPDRFLDAKTTVKLSSEASYMFRDTLFDLMGVVQGRTIDELEWCAGELLRHAYIRYLAIPRCTTEYVSRVESVKRIRQRYGDIRIHLLGFSDNLEDDILASQLPGVMGIDSATPVHYGMRGGILYGELRQNVNRDFGRRPADFWQREEVTPEMVVNILRIQHWVQRGIAQREVA